MYSTVVSSQQSVLQNQHTIFWSFFQSEWKGGILSGRLHTGVTVLCTYDIVCRCTGKGTVLYQNFQQLTAAIYRLVMQTDAHCIIVVPSTTHDHSTVLYGIV